MASHDITFLATPILVPPEKPLSVKKVFTQLTLALRSHRCSPVAPVGAFAAAATVVVVRV
jgi:hypothetical protein